MTIHKDYKFQQGLYFNMSDDEYHAIPCLSASGLKLLLNQPSKFWYWSWMNPDKVENDSDAKIIGRAFHKRILEGKKAFDDAYAREFTCDDPDIIKTGDDIKNALKNEGLAFSFKTKQEGMERLINHDPLYADKFYDELKAQYEKTHANKIFLSDWVCDRAEMCAKVIENHPYLKTSFIGGYPEVTCVWFDEKYQEWFKCRYDYLKVSAIVDLKTFTRMTGKPIERLLPEIISNYSYHIQASHYLDSMPHAKKLAREGFVFGADNVNPEWLKAFGERDCDQFNFVFQQKEEVPNAYGVIYSREHTMHDTAVAMISSAVDTYKKYCETYGDDMWAEILNPMVLTGDDYPQWVWY